MRTILLISPYWKEQHRWMVSSVKLAKLWQRMGYRVVAVCMGKRSGVEEVSKTLTIYRVWDLFLPDPFNYGISPAFFLNVVKALKNEKPDIVIVNKVLFWSSLAVPLLRMLGKKPIVTTDALVGMTWHPRGIFPKIIMTIGGWTAGWAVLLAAKRIVFFHPQPRSLLALLRIDNKSTVIPTGIDTKQFTLRHPAKHPARLCHPDGNLLRRSAQDGGGITQFGRKSGIVITYIGRLESIKGVDDFLAAAVPLKAQFPEINIRVVGWHKKGHRLIEQYAGSVEFHGLRNDIPAILDKTDIFVLPSHSEGLSNALMEAMSSGCACIATEVGGNLYLIQNGVSGFLFPPGDREMLRSHIRRLICDPDKRRGLGMEARRRMETMFDWSVIEQKYAKLFADE